MIKVWMTVGVVALLTVSCGENVAEAEQTTQEKVETVGSENAAEATMNTDNASAAEIQDNSNSAASEVRLNPPHGQPGHDCAIAVGAPLDGSSPNGVGTSPSAQPVVQPMIQPDLKVSAPVGSGLNPPHGQPGHDCAVAVGAPLPVK